MKEIVEGFAKIILPEQEELITKRQKVFYNPEMRLNRDISVLLTKAKKITSAVLPLAASGIRAIRLLKESSCKEIKANDISPSAIESIKKNLKINNISYNQTDQENNSCKLFNKEANLFLMEETSAEYIDIDPFGSPNPFLQESIRKMKHNGILAITATDTASLSGTYVATCKRYYWAKPFLNSLKHETGLRILIRKAQLVASQYDKALVPIFSYWKKHYFRIFFIVYKSKSKTNDIIQNHKYLYYHPNNGEHSLLKKAPNAISIGPFWAGELHNPELIKEMIKNITPNIHKETIKFLELINEEAQVKNQFLVDIHNISKRIKLDTIGWEPLFSIIKEKGFDVVRTHLSPYGIKTTMPYEQLIETIKQIIKKN